MKSRDCNHCADAWVKNAEKDETLALVCSQCMRGYCRDCVVRDEGRVHCPQCFENLDYIIKECLQDPDDTPERPAITEIEERMRELERLGNEGPHALVAPKAPARRRIRRPIPPASPPAPRPDNVREMEVESNMKMIRIMSDRILLGQVRAHLKRKYGITALEFLETVYSTKSEIIGSFPLEIIHSETYEGSDLNICAGGPAVQAITKLLPDTYKQSGDTWSDGVSRIQFTTGRARDILATAEMTVVQNSFNGRELYVADERTLDKQGSVLVDTITPGIIKYFKRGYRLMIPLTADIANCLFG